MSGLPTKPEQSDLLQALYGRNGDSPVPVLAAATPADCFAAAFEAVRIAVKYMTPVLLLSDGYLGNGSEPWRIPATDELPEIPVVLRTDPKGFFPYLRDPETLSRPWAIPFARVLISQFSCKIFSAISTAWVWPQEAFWARRAEVKTWRSTTSTIPMMAVATRTSRRLKPPASGVRGAGGAGPGSGLSVYLVCAMV